MSTKKRKTIIRDYFEQFKKIREIYDSHCQYKIREEYVEHEPKNLQKEITQYPSFFMWDESKNMVIDSLTIKKTQNYLLYNGKYSINNLHSSFSISCKLEDRLNIKQIMEQILKIVCFFVSYTKQKGYFNRLLPIITIYYTDVNKVLTSNDNNGVIGKSMINSAFTYVPNTILTKSRLPEIVIYRKEELYKIMIHELIHFYSIDFHVDINEIYTKSLQTLLSDNYKVVNGKNQPIKINPKEAYTETIAILLNIIFSTNPFTKKNFDNNFRKELLFSIYQIAKIFNYQNIKKSKIVFKQETFAFEYYYLKTKLLLNLDQLLEFINNPNYHRKNNTQLINLKFPVSDLPVIRKKNKDIDYDAIYASNRFLNFGHLLVRNDPIFEEMINQMLEKDKFDNSLRMSILEIQS